VLVGTSEANKSLGKVPALNRMRRPLVSCLVL